MTNSKIGLGAGKISLYSMGTISSSDEAGEEGMWGLK